ncbi:bifunctional DNA primase/polymerase [Devosia sp. A449]
MSNPVFMAEAPKYWNRGFGVTPVEGKTPVMTGWTGQLGSLPNKAKQTALLEQYGNKGVGLLLGGALPSGQVLIALDVDDDRLLNLALSLLGLNRVKRRAVLSGKRGKKGGTIFGRAEKSLKPTVIKGGHGLGNIDVLAAGKQTVMPPSIHPETGKPYETLGADLLEVDLAELPEITAHHIDLARVTTGSEHAGAVISGKATHDAGVALAAILVQARASDEEIVAIFEGLLPEDYAGNSLAELAEWIESARKKGFDAPQEEGSSLTQVLVGLALTSTMGLFNDGDGHAYATLPHLGRGVAVRVESASFTLWLRHLVHTELARPVSSGPLREAVATLEAIALFDHASSPVHVRIAGDTRHIVIDLGGDNGGAVQIDGNGWQVSSNSEFKFVRGAGFRALAGPQRNGDLGALQTFLGLDDLNYRLLLAFLINGLKPSGPYFILLVEGEQGSGKSFFCEIIKRILDPNVAVRLRLPDKPQDLMIQAKEYRLLNFDNASGMSGEMSDVLCSLATGGGIAVRKLYSDGDLYVMSYSRPFVINGIGGYASRPDLMERGIPIRLSPMAEGGRKTEAELFEEFDRILPGVLGCLYDAISSALRTFDAVEPPRHLRMADAARWIKASESGLGQEPNALIDAIATAQRDFVVDRINEDPLVVRLRNIAQRQTYEGYIGDLFAEVIGEVGFSLGRSLPKSPSQLSNQLKRMRPAMAQAGVIVEFLDKDRKGRQIRVSVDDGERKKQPF